MAAFDLMVRGGRVWTPQGFRDDTDVLVKGGKIAGVEPSDAGSGEAERVIDARTLVVMPGLIDTHSHHRDPGFTHKEDIVSASRAAAAGGVTVSIGMPNVSPPTTTVELYLKLIEHHARHSVVDFNHNPSPTNLEEIPGLAEAGCLGFKLFMVIDGKRSYPHMPGLGIRDHGDIARILEVVAETDRPLMVHPNDQGVFEVVERRHWEAGSVGPEPYAKAEWMFDGAVWNSAVATLVELQRGIGGRLHVLHMMTDRTVDLIRRAKADGQDVSAEVNAFALFLSRWEEVAELGPLALGRCLKDEWIDGLWAGIRDGTIDVLGTDHAPHGLDEKERGWENMWEAPTGTPQLQHYLTKLLDATHRGLLTLEDVVRITSLNPAKRFGLHPRKGTIEAGADADLVLVDYEREHLLTDQGLYSKAGYNPYRGQTVRGYVKATILRGVVIAEDGRVQAEPGTGRHVPPVASGAHAAQLAAAKNS